MTEGLVDLAVNVREHTPPTWLRQCLAGVDPARYPDPSAAHRAIAARHGRPVEQVLATAGAAEAFTLLARALRPRHAVVVHPQFSEPERALRAAGHEVAHVVLPEPFELDPGLVPVDADLVVIGNPTNPTSVHHPAQALRSLARPGRVLVIDEAFADCVPGEAESLAGAADLDGVVVVRSLTKMWGLAGLRAGYLLGPAEIVAAAAAAQPHWGVSSTALAACVACLTPPALAEAAAWAAGMTGRRARLTGALATIDGVRIVPGAAASFLLVHLPHPDPQSALRALGFAVRSAGTFPGLGADWIRVAVRDDQTSANLAAAVKEILNR